MYKRGVSRRWQTTQDVVWEVGRKGSGDFVVVPAGFEFENSVPLLFRWFIQQDDPKFLFPALIHDYMLESGIYGAAQAAAEWFDACRKAKAPMWKAKPAFVAIAAWAVFKPKFYKENYNGKV